MQSKIAALHRTAVKTFARCTSALVQDAVTFLSHQAAHNTHMTQVGGSDRSGPCLVSAHVSTCNCSPFTPLMSVCLSVCLCVQEARASTIHLAARATYHTAYSSRKHSPATLVRTLGCKAFALASYSFV